MQCTSRCLHDGTTAMMLQSCVSPSSSHVQLLRSDGVCMISRVSAILNDTNTRGHHKLLSRTVVIKVNTSFLKSFLLYHSLPLRTSLSLSLSLPPSSRNTSLLGTSAIHLRCFNTMHYPFGEQNEPTMKTCGHS